MKIKVILTYFLLVLSFCAYGQIKEYSYKRALIGVQDQWHKVILPTDIFGKVSPELSDIRIFGLTKSNDTIEAPYILKLDGDKTIQKDIVFNLINQSKNDNGYYFTYEMPVQSAVNQIQLDFRQQNFDWKLTLEGSQNQQEWFSIIEDYRILSIKNEMTDFKFTKVSFPDSKYRYMRVLIDSKKKPDLITTKISWNEIIKGNVRDYNIQSTKIEEKKKDKQTIINVDLTSVGPVSKVSIFVKDTFDYYRPVTIKYLSDSIKTDQGWKYNYNILTAGTLNSMEKSEFIFTGTMLQKLQIIVDNRDNTALQIDSVAVQGFVYELTARFNEAATYYLTYGNNRATKPQFDIDHFIDKIPAILTTLKLGDELLIKKEAIHETEPLFKNKAWLWAIMTIVIMLLGWFSLKMIRQQ
ncbi:MAG: DUF3999 family protein [Saprospiraceae bacterium]|nr:DUF3999 family protein [Saprospiraceae bacterium]